jgi:hypothetical protein
MSLKLVLIFSGVVLAGVGFEATTAHALTLRECSIKFKAAQADGSAKGIKWNQFRKETCSKGAPSIPEVSMTTTSASGVVFPTTISPEHSSKPPGQGRMHTCLDQFIANRGTGGNGGLRWVRRSGGYYFECDQRLRGVSR